MSLASELPIPPHLSDKGLEVNGPSTFRKLKKKKREESPPSYRKQNFNKSKDGFYGLNVKPNEEINLVAERAKNGAWPNPVEFKRAFASGCSGSNSRKKVGKFLGPEEALVLLHDCRDRQLKEPFNLKDNSHAGVTVPKPPPHLSPEDELLFRKDIDIVWCRGSGCYCPRSGSINLGDWDDKSMTDDYQPFTDHLKMLPFFAASEVPSEEDVAIIDKFMIDNLDSDAMREWDWSLGYPTVVSAMMVVHRKVASKCGLFWENKNRLVTDLRCANAVSKNEELALPTHVSFAQSLHCPCLTAKQDAKSGFHQVRADPAQAHMLAVLWRGRIFYYTCMPFGVRNAPANFTKRMQTAANESKSEMKKSGLQLPFADGVYVDDFFQGWDYNDQVGPKSFIESLTKRGIVLGRSKCLPPDKAQEILGLEIDSHNRILRVSDRKITATKMEARQLINDNDGSASHHVDTLRVAQFLGRINSLEPALANSLLVVRPLFEDLKLALTSEGEELFPVGSDIEALNKPRDADKYSWEVVPLTLSKLSIEALEFLIKEIESMNGQSFDKSIVTLLISWDASSYAAGARVFMMTSDGYKFVCALEGAYFEQEWMGFSSMAREAIALLLVVKHLAKEYPELLRNAVIKGVTDNQGLACRYWKGSTKLEVNISLIELVKVLRSFGAVIQSLVWLPRELLQAEDDLSKPEGMSPLTVVDQSWFDHWCLGLPESERPNIDAFSNHDDAKLSNYVVCTGNLENVVPGKVVLFDGLTVKWRADHILWMYPPNITSIIKKAVKNWYASLSRRAYLVLAYKGAEQTERFLSKFNKEQPNFTSELMYSRDELVKPKLVTASANQKRWEAKIYVLCKA